MVVQNIKIDFFNGIHESAGDCETLTGFPLTEFHLGLGDYIMEAFGRIGFLLDRLTLIVTPSQVGDYPSVYSAGGPFGAPFDATPSPNKFGPCALVSLDGSVLEGEFPIINTIR